MARRLPGLPRALDTSSIASVAYGEIASSIYFALGIVAVYALGFMPWILLLVGGLFLLVALSYAEGTAAIPEVGGAAMFVRRAFNDQAGFLTGWVLLLDYLIVIALAALFVPHYLGHAVGIEALRDRPWDVVAGIVVIVLVSASRLVRRTGLYRIAVLVAAVALAGHLLLVVAGFAVLFSSDSLGQGLDLGGAPTWSSIAFALPVAMLAYTGLETVANLAAETREPGQTLPRGLFAGIGAAVLVSVAIGIVGISAFPAGGQTSELGTTWLRAPLVGIASAFDGHLPAGIVDAFRVFIGVTGVLILLGAVVTSIAGAGRLAYSLGRHDMLPHAFGVLNRRTVIAPVSIVSTAVLSSGLLLVAFAVGREVRFLASLYSFGVLLAFAAAQVAVIRLRVREPDLPRPFRVPLNVRLGRTEIPVAALIGIPLTVAIWVAGLATHESTRIAGPAWVAAGVLVFVAVRRAGGEPVLGRVAAAVPDLVPDAEGIYGRILVPVKLGQIGDEVLGTAIRLAEEHGGALRAVHVIRVPLSLPLDAELLAQEERAAASLVDARMLAKEHGVELESQTIRARSIGHAIVGEARDWEADLIVLGSSPRWRRQSRFFSPTVDYVLRQAPCEVMVIAYPQGVLEAEEGVDAGLAPVPRS
ncbi:MAG: amino acid permease [Gaiellaceae bacterium]